MQQAMADFNKEKSRFKYLLEQESPQAIHALQQLIGGAEDFVGIQAPNSATGSSSGSGVSNETSGTNPLIELFIAAIGASAIPTLMKEIFHGQGVSYELESIAENDTVSFMLTFLGKTKDLLDLPFGKMAGNGWVKS